VSTIFAWTSTLLSTTTTMTYCVVRCVNFLFSVPSFLNDQFTIVECSSTSVVCRLPHCDVHNNHREVFCIAQMVVFSRVECTSSIEKSSVFWCQDISQGILLVQQALRRLLSGTSLRPVLSLVCTTTSWRPSLVRCSEIPV
jgi:hypothetical protein